MIHPKCIIPECHADTFFIELLKGLRPAAPNHQHGKTKVLKVLQSIDVPKALAVIDKDPHARVKIDLTKLDYELADDSNDFLRLYKHNTKNYYIIEINKEFEYWLFKKVIPESSVDLKEFGIPSDYINLGKYFKDANIRSKDSVYRFFKALINSKSVSLQTFATWVEECTG